MTRPRIRLIHWKAAETPERSARLRRAGFAVIDRPLAGGKGLQREWADPPDAYVIDQSRLPSQGRDIAVLLRQRKSTRHVPIVFVNGPAEKVAATRRLFPDATYTTWGEIGVAVRRAIARPPASPLVHGDAMAGYSGTPLPRKLGIKEGHVVVLVNAPRDFAVTLGTPPGGVTFRRQDRGARDLTLWFVTRRKDLERRIATLANKVVGGGLWIAWPKKTSGVETDVSEAVVRSAGLAAGLVDYKICAIDQTWSGLKFARRAPLPAIRRDR